MTPEELRDIDRKVAEAIGGSVMPHDGSAYVLEEPANSGPKLSRRIRPSVDWNDAMFAAERCQEFTKDYVLFPRGWNKDGSGSIYWVVAKVNQANELCDDFVDNRSGPLCVCMAILALKGKA